jgi:proline-specific peptidase
VRPEGGRGEGYIDFRGYRTWYRIMGEPSNSPGRRPLVFLNGGPGVPWPDRSRHFDDLVAAGRPIVVYDQLGCGRSDWPDDPSLWTVDLFVAELATLRRTLGLEAVHLFGASWGGMLALEYALTQPDGLLSMILVGTPVDMPLYEQEAHRLRAELPPHTQKVFDRVETRWRPVEHQGSGRVRPGRTVRQMQRRAALIRALVPIMRTDVAQRMAAPVSAVPALTGLASQIAAIEWARRHALRVSPIPTELLEMMAGTNRQVLEAMWGPSGALPLGPLRDWSVIDRLSEIRVPTLVANGRYDMVTPVQAHVLADGLPDSRCVIFERSAHVPMIEEPTAFNDTVLQFLETVDPAEPALDRPDAGSETRTARP